MHTITMMTLPITFALSMTMGTVVWANLNLTGFTSPCSITCTYTINANPVSRTVDVRIPAGTGIDLIANIETAHVISDIRVEVKERASGTRDHFRNTTYVVAIFVHQSREDGKQRRFDAVTVVNVHMIPTAFRCELLYVHPYRGVWAALD